MGVGFLDLALMPNANSFFHFLALCEAFVCSSSTWQQWIWWWKYCLLRSQNPFSSLSHTHKQRDKKRNTHTSIPRVIFVGIVFLFMEGSIIVITLNWKRLFWSHFLHLLTGSHAFCRLPEIHALPLFKSLLN